MGFLGPIISQSHETIDGHTSFFTFDDVNDGPLLLTEIEVNGKKYTVKHSLSWEYLISSGKYWKRYFDLWGIKNEIIEGLAKAAPPETVRPEP